MCSHFSTVLYGELYILFVLDIWIICLLHTSLCLESSRLSTFTHKLLVSPENESIVLPKRPIIHFIFSDDGNSSK